MPAPSSQAPAAKMNRNVSHKEGGGPYLGKDIMEGGHGVSL